MYGSRRVFLTISVGGNTNQDKAWVQVHRQVEPDSMSVPPSDPVYHCGLDIGTSFRIDDGDIWVSVRVVCAYLERYNRIISRVIAKNEKIT
jgi:hypothetical protein